MQDGRSGGAGAAAAQKNARLSMKFVAQEPRWKKGKKEEIIEREEKGNALDFEVAATVPGKRNRLAVSPSSARHQRLCNADGFEARTTNQEIKTTILSMARNSVGWQTRSGEVGECSGTPCATTRRVKLGHLENSQHLSGYAVHLNVRETTRKRKQQDGTSGSGFYQSARGLAWALYARVRARATLQLELVGALCRTRDARTRVGPACRDNVKLLHRAIDHDLKVPTNSPELYEQF
ncbi:hypothetical protein C8F04DRAFT_1192800 [Mycena alexandri]|uniref:Uncharacterized protein n=1 Tax=Mycena alexandri TaxID=1745969 RepID=A0AAD6SBR7_9AGAR|nr:hypothetical protein C8F04DRAFT_1192800 [Mycena alexandri]